MYKTVKNIIILVGTSVFLSGCSSIIKYLLVLGA